jgi:hypothetical protein
VTGVMPPFGPVVRSQDALGTAGDRRGRSAETYRSSGRTELSRPSAPSPEPVEGTVAAQRDCNPEACQKKP